MVREVLCRQHLYARKKQQKALRRAALRRRIPSGHERTRLALALERVQATSCMGAHPVGQGGLTRATTALRAGAHLASRLGALGSAAQQGALGQAAHALENLSLEIGRMGRKIGA
jgi:hypothetical protein